MVASISILLALTIVAQGDPTALVDWRSRAQVGLEVLYEWSAEWGSYAPQGGGTASTDHGTLLDCVYAKEGEDFLCVRLITRTNWGLRGTQVRFLRVHPDGSLIDDAPLESFCWEAAQDDFPGRDPVGSATELVVGLDREHDVVIRDPLFSSLSRDALPVRETVEVTTPRPCDPIRNRWFRSDMARLKLTRTWTPTDSLERGATSGDVRLLSLRDVCTFEPSSRVIEKRDFEISYLVGESPLVQVERRIMHEVSFYVHSFAEELETALSLREAYRVALADPRGARHILDRWAREKEPLRDGTIEDVAAQVWLLTARGEREHSISCTLSGTSPLDIDESDTYEAVRLGRLGRLFEQLGLDAERHRNAYRSMLEGHERSEEATTFLRRVYDRIGRLPRPGTMPDALRSQGGALFEAALRELSD